MKKYKSLCPLLRESAQSSLWLSSSLTLIILVVFFLVPEKIGFYPLGSEDFAIRNSILFPFFHANIFHALCNILCLWTIRGKHYLVPSFIISFLCSLLPEYSPLSCFVPFINASSDGACLPIMGFSGILFAIIGIKYGYVAKWKTMLSRTWLFFLITAFIPNVAMLFHLYCIIVGYLYGFIKSTLDLWREAKICL